MNGNSSAPKDEVSLSLKYIICSAEALALDTFFVVIFVDRRENFACTDE